MCTWMLIFCLNGTADSVAYAVAFTNVAYAVACKVPNTTGYAAAWPVALAINSFGSLCCCLYLFF